MLTCLKYSIIRLKEIVCVPCSSGPGAVDYIVDHAEVDFVFVQNTKIKGVKILISSINLYLWK